MVTGPGREQPRCVMPVLAHRTQTSRCGRWGKKEWRPGVRSGACVVVACGSPVAASLARPLALPTEGQLRVYPGVVAAGALWEASASGLRGAGDGSSPG
jgi:hypothetical protein